MNITMIGVHKSGNRVIGFRILDTDSGEIKDVPIDNIKQVLSAGKVEIENLRVEGDRVLGSNGALQRYPSIVNGRLSGKSPLIIISELVDNCYRVTNYMGEIVDIEEQRAIEYAKSEGISNGKIVTSEDGSSHISSIVGSYKQDKLLAGRKYGKTLVAKMKLLGKSDFNVTEDYLAYAKNDEIQTLNIGTGILGIKPSGFKNCRNLTEVSLPETCTSISESAFNGCIKLKKIVIPEGVKVIHARAFANCLGLEEVILPNSLKIIETSAFNNCRKLKVIECGPVPIDIAYGAIPRGVKRKIRRGNR